MHKSRTKRGLQASSILWPCIAGTLIIAPISWYFVRCCTSKINRIPKQCGAQQSGGLISANCEDWSVFLQNDARNWARMVEHEIRFLKSQPKLANKMRNTHHYWAQNWHPTLACMLEERLGSLADGGKWVCNPSRISPAAMMEARPCLVYSFGSNNDFSFEKDVYQITQCEIHTFDPYVGDVPRGLPPYVNFHPLGLADRDNASKRLFSLPSIQAMLNHTSHGHHIDILKFDIEGSEWTFLFSALQNAQLNHVRQLLFELHNWPATHGLLGANVLDLMKALRANNFVAFHREPNLLCPHCIEFSFLRLDRRQGSLI
jgi:hypothetical protein